MDIKEFEFPIFEEWYSKCKKNMFNVLDLYIGYYQICIGMTADKYRMTLGNSANYVFNIWVNDNIKSLFYEFDKADSDLAGLKEWYEKGTAELNEAFKEEIKKNYLK